jgi:hypothetical protein
MLGIKTDSKGLPKKYNNDYYEVNEFYYNLAASFDVGWLSIELPAMIILHSVFSGIILYNTNYNNFYFYIAIL